MSNFVFQRGTTFDASAGLHSLPQPVGNSSLKDAATVDVEGLQSPCRHGAGDVAAHGQVHVQNEFQLVVLGGVGGLVLDPGQSRMDFGAAAAVQLQLQVRTQGQAVLLTQIWLRQGAGVGGGDQLRPGYVLQAQPDTGE